jgi:hypothetical protein
MLVLHAKVQIKIDCMVTQRYYRQSKHDLLLIALVEIKIHFLLRKKMIRKPYRCSNRLQTNFIEVTPHMINLLQTLAKFISQQPQEVKEQFFQYSNTYFSVCQSLGL